MTHRMRHWVVVMFCISAIGCSVLAPLPDRSRFFNLMATPAGTGDRDTGRAAGESPVYGLGPIELPAYLDRSELVTRVSPTEVTYSQTDRWAEPLAATFAAVLLQDLSVLLDTHSIFSYPWTGGQRVDYQIEINVLQFDSDVSGNTRLIARWRVRNVRTGTELVTKETNVTHPQTPGDSGARVTALSDTLHVLAQDIADVLRHLPASAAPPAAAARRK
jgi:uncharacterized lipoprotein YmbA